MENLEILRGDWERALTPLCVIQWKYECFVVLTKNDLFHCHRYFTIGADWAISVDKREVSLQEALEWLGIQASKD